MKQYNEREYKSHIQMPYVVMKHFASRDNFLFYYDFKELAIKRGHPNTLNTSKNYYSIEAEQYFSDEIESKIGSLIKFLEDDNLRKKKSCEKYDEIAFMYLYSLLSRSSEYLATFIDFPLLGRFCDGDDERRGLIATAGIEASKSSNIFRNMFHVYYMRNISNEEFVLPIGGAMHSAGMIICPVSPNWAILFFDKEFEKCGRQNFEFEMEDDEIIHDINIRLILQEKSSGNQFVISRGKELIKDLVKELNLDLQY